MVNETHHDVFELRSRHLAVGNADSGLWDQGGYGLGDAVDGVDAVMDEKELAAALQFPQDRFTDHQLIVTGQEGLYRASLLGGRGNHREIAYAQKRHLQGPR